MQRRANQPALHLWVCPHF